MSITGYEYRMNGGTPVNVGMALSASVTGLTANTSYNFEVRSYTSSGYYSEWSPVVTETTLIPQTGLVEWLKADAITGLADNDPISTWTASVGNNGTQTGTARPTYQTNELNGLPIVRFDGSNDYFNIGNFSALTAGEVFIAVKIDTDPPGAGGQAGLWDLGNGTATAYPFTDGLLYESFGATVRKDGIALASVSSWRVYNVYSAANDWQAFLDGASIHSTATNTVGFPSTCLLGGDTGTGFYLDGDVAEFILYSRKLTAPERASVLSYLETKWAI